MPVTIKDAILAVKLGKPTFYLDTNVLLDMLRGRNPTSAELVDKIRNRGWSYSSSYYALMEVINREQESIFFKNKLRAGISADDINRMKYEKDLTRVQLRTIERKVVGFFENKYPDLELVFLDEDGWDEAIGIKTSTNLMTDDTLHLAAAIITDCSVLVTRDTFLKRIAQDYISCDQPEQVIVAIERL